MARDYNGNNRQNENENYNDVTNRIKSVKHCPGCGSADFVMDDCRCELICRRCGMVIDDEFIQYGP